MNQPINIETKIESIENYLAQKSCIGLRVTANEICDACDLREKCSELRMPRLIHEEQKLEVDAIQAEVDAEFKEFKAQAPGKAKAEVVKKALTPAVKVESKPVEVEAPVVEKKKKAVKEDDVNYKAIVADILAERPEKVARVKEIIAVYSPVTSKSGKSPKNTRISQKCLTILTDKGFIVWKKGNKNIEWSAS